MKFTYEDLTRLMDKVRSSQLDKETKIRLNFVLLDVIDNLTYNEQTRLLDYDIDKEDELDEHQYIY